MELEISAQAKDEALNRRVAITVVVLSVFAALCGIRNGNINQSMDQAQNASLDRWNEYQATRTKLHVDEASRTQIALTADPAKAAPVLKALDGGIAKYKAETPQLAAAAKGQGDLYDALKRHHDQFDAADAALTTAISLSAVAALAESTGVLWLSWAFGGFGLMMGVAGFLGLSLHFDALARLLG